MCRTNCSCSFNVDKMIILSFFIIGCLLTIIGILLNLCSCLLFCRAKSLNKTPYGIFIIGLSISDIIKLLAEYIFHIVYFYIDHPYFVCSISWFFTLMSENLSYIFLCALGIERNLKVWMSDRRYLISRRRAYIISLFLILFVIIHDHPFLLIPYDVSYCFLKLDNNLILFSCDNAYYKSYGYQFSLTDLIFIESVGLNNLILPILILLTNLILIFGLRRRAYHRRHRLGTRKSDDWKEQSVILYMFISSITFLLLTTPTGILNGWSAIHNHKMATNNLSIMLELLEIVHHCSHFPILLMTSSIIRIKTFQILFHPRSPRQTSCNSRQLTRPHHPSNSSSQPELHVPRSR